MKTMKKLALLLPMLAAAVCAQAQQRKIAPAGQDYPIENVTSASGQNVTYQWFRDGVEIPSATGATYTVPANLAKHENGLHVNLTVGSVFQRAAYGIDCPGGAAMSNEIIIYFCELMVNGVCWARANSDVYGRISANPWDFGGFFQWNRAEVGYSSTSPTEGIPIDGWNSTANFAAEWTNGFPCPEGWRLPTVRECQNLHAMSQPAGGIWTGGGVRGIPSGVSGWLYGYNTDYCTMSNLSGCIFLPAVGYRSNTIGGLTNQNIRGLYWTNENVTPAMGWNLRFTSTTGSDPVFTNLKAYAFSIRCVQDVVQ